MSVVLKITSSLAGRRRVGWVFTGTVLFSVRKFSRADMETLLSDPHLTACVGETITEDAFSDFMASRDQEAQTSSAQLIVSSAAPGRRRAGEVFTGATAYPLNHFSRAQLWAILGDRFLTMTKGYVLTLDNLGAFLRERGTDEAAPIEDPDQEAWVHGVHDELMEIRARAPGPEFDDGEGFDDVEPPPEQPAPAKPGRPRKSPLKSA